jgi:hypothetical protein
MRETTALVMPLPRSSRLRGEERQRGRHREERIWVRAPSLMGRSEMTLPRTSSGRRLIRSGPPASLPPRGGGSSLSGCCGFILFA